MTSLEDDCDVCVPALKSTYQSDSFKDPAVLNGKGYKGEESHECMYYIRKEPQWCGLHNKEEIHEENNEKNDYQVNLLKKS